MCRQPIRWAEIWDTAGSACSGRGTPSPSRPPIVPRTFASSFRTVSEGALRWSAPRINSELRKLGIDVSQATVAKYMVRRRQQPALLATEGWLLDC